jgi:hypothetical protein
VSPPQDNDNLLSYVRDSSVNLSYFNLITFKHPRLMLLQHNKSRMTSKYCQRLLAIPQIALMCVPRISLGFLLTYLYSQVPSAHQPTHATSVPALDHLPTSSTHQSATSPVPVVFKLKYIRLDTNLDAKMTLNLRA